jgi:hypothetical protein
MTNYYFSACVVITAESRVLPSAIVTKKIGGNEGWGNVDIMNGCCVNLAVVRGAV